MWYGVVCLPLLPARLAVRFSLDELICRAACRSEEGVGQEAGVVGDTGDEGGVGGGQTRVYVDCHYDRVGVKCAAVDGWQDRQ